VPAEMRTFLDPPPRGAPGSGDGPRRAVGSRSIAAVGEGDRRARARVGAGAGAAAPAAQEASDSALGWRGSDA